MTHATDKKVTIDYTVVYSDGTSVKFPQDLKLIETNEKILSDDDILKYASSEYSKPKMMGNQIILGKHNNQNLVVEFPCSDFCPGNTVRIIRYDVELNQCKKIPGKIRAITVPIAIGMAEVKFCMPFILTENWDKYIK